MKLITDDEIHDLNLKYGWFEFGDAQSAKTKAFVRDVEAICAEKAEKELADTTNHNRRLETEIAELKAEREGLQMTLRSLKMRGEGDD